MSGRHVKPTSLLILNNLMTDEYRRIVVHRAVTHIDTVSQHAQKRLQTAIRKSVNLPGFTDPTRAIRSAKRQALIAEVIKETHRSSALMGAVLQTWTESHLDLREAVSNYLAADRDPTGEPPEIEEEFVMVWSQSEMRSRTNDFVAQNASFNWDDVALMICCVTGGAPVPDDFAESLVNYQDEKHHSHDQPELQSQELTQSDSSFTQEVNAMTRLPSILQDMIAQLDALPSDTAEWDQIPQFIAEIHALTTKKLQERDQDRATLRDALVRLAREADSALIWWGFEVSNWSADRCSWSQAASLAQQVHQWQTGLLRHAELRQVATGSRAQEQVRRNEMHGLESDIERSYSELKAAFDAALPIPEPTEFAETDLGTISSVGMVVGQANEIQKIASADLITPDTTDEASVEQGIWQADTETLLITAQQAPSIAKVPPEPAIAPTTADLVARVDPAPDSDLGDASFRPPAAENALAEGVASLPDEILLPMGTAGVDEPSELVVDTLWVDSASVIGDAVTQDINLPASTELLIENHTDLVGVPALRSVSEVISQLDGDDSDEAWHTLAWSMVAENDLAGAYWLVRSLAAMGRSVPVPDWLLAASHASRWVTPDKPGLVQDLLKIARNHEPEIAAPAESVLALAAALIPALVTPFSGMIGWLNTPSCCPALHEFVSSIHAFASIGFGLQYEDILGATGDKQRSESILAASREAHRWLDEAPTRRKRVTSVWRALVGSKGRLREFLMPVSENRQEALSQVRASLEFWQHRSQVYSLFDSINVAGSEGKPERVTGAGKQDLYREVEKAAELAEHWCNLVERVHNIEARGDWFREQVMLLRDNVLRTWPDVELMIEELLRDGQLLAVSAAAATLQISLLQLRNLLNLAALAPVPQANNDTVWTLPITTVDSLDLLLGNRLLWLPEVNLDDDGLPTQATLPLIASALRRTHQEGRSLVTAAYSWLSERDFRFIDRLLAALTTDQDRYELQHAYDQALGASRATLRVSISETESAVEQAFLDDIITDEQRSTYLAPFASLTLEDVMNFRYKLAELARVRHEIEQLRQERLSYLRTQSDAIAQRLIVSHSASGVQREAIAFIDKSLDRGDTRVAEEVIARLGEVLDTGSPLPDDWYTPPSNRDCLKEFKQAAQRIEQWADQAHGNLNALVGAAEDGQTMAGIQFARLGEPRRKEIRDALRAWRALKQQAEKSSNRASIATIFRYLGFNLKTGDATSVEVIRTGGDWLHARATMSAGDLARPIPEFGSQSQERYDLICLWERPGADTIAARLRDLHLDAHTVIVFYLGRITERQKRDVIRVSRDQELAIGVLDETLLVFLAQELDARLPVFLRCALPFSALNPYRPFQAGDVPREMFFGREAMAKELQRDGGSCLVYGGRQLGKSALLRHVQAQFHHPEREQYAWVENMKLVYDPAAGKGARNLWRNLREGFKRERLIDHRITTDKPEEIIRYIKEAMLTKPKQRVLLMLDEADDFLDADASSGFREAIALRELMLNTGRRFKVIFAGLHNVQRFQGIPDQPLAHFGTPLCVGPLEPGAAQQLVRQPMEVLGYRFADDGTVLRILSYTNYHPGLIQYFCQELLKQLRDRTSMSLPPYLIQQADVEAIYRSQQVRDRIRERFEWTLALDTHYQAIAWTLVEDQIKVRDGYARAYAPNDILWMAQVFWPAGFVDVTSDQLRGWLDEMCGLGVLVRNSSGHYRLRSPNMVRLLGKETDISDRLIDLIEKQPEPSMEADTHHATLDDEGIRYSPLTYAQERSLAQPRFGVGIVFASEILGSKLLPSAVRRFLPADLPPGIGDCTEIPQGVAPQDLDDWLKAYLKAQSRAERMILYRQVPFGAPSDPAELITAANRFCQRRQAKDRWLRVLFFFDPKSTWNWLEIAEPERRNIEDAVDAVLSPRYWTLSAVRRRLVQHDKMDKDDIASREVLSATGGWPYLLDELFKRCGKQTDPRPFAQDITKEINTPDSRLASDLRSGSGLARNAVAQRIFSFIAEEGQVPEELLSPDMIGGSPELTMAQCNQAKHYLIWLSLVHLQNEILSTEPTIARAMMHS